PSLDEMVHVASEMQREGFTLPLMIGGATTSRVHTAVKIAPQYSGTTVHVLDASRSVPVVSSLTSEIHKSEFVKNVRNEYKKVREDHAKRQDRKEILPFEEAVANRTRIDWAKAEIPTPARTGISHWDDYPLEEIREFIDWTPFFISWEMGGKFPAILEDPVSGEEARKLFADANHMLDLIIAEKWLQARAVAGIFPANATGEDIEVYTDESRKSVRATLCMLRQQVKKRKGQPNKSLADFIAPKETGISDYIGGFAVTTGVGIEKKLKEFDDALDDYSSIMLKALADRLAEAFAELMHKKVRTEIWGYARGEKLSNEELVKETYRGIRPAPGYPANPDHTEKRILFDLLKVEQHTGITLTESFAMYPASSVSGLYFAHPESDYFAVGQIGRDQIEEYARRKGMAVGEVEKWLSPVLGYEKAPAETQP
ncbi:MAG: methionine synthase, partial [Balneolaceae bacterium]